MASWLILPEPCDACHPHRGPGARQTFSVFSWIHDNGKSELSHRITRHNHSLLPFRVVCSNSFVATNYPRRPFVDTCCNTRQKAPGLAQPTLPQPTAWFSLRLTSQSPSPSLTCDSETEMAGSGTSAYLTSSSPRCSIGMSAFVRAMRKSFCKHGHCRAAGPVFKTPVDRTGRQGNVEPPISQASDARGA